MRDIQAFLNRNIFIPLYDFKEQNHRLRHVRDIEMYNALSRGEMEAEQWRNLKHMLEHAFENVPFYRRIYRQAGISPGDIQTPMDMVKLPTLTREDIRNHGAELQADGANRDELVETGTGGTISSPITIFLSPECMDLRLAATIAFNKWFGYELGDKAVLFWGAAQDFPKLDGIRAVKAKVRNFLTSRILWMPTSYLDDSVMAEYYEQLVRYKPAVIQAYPTPLYLFAKFMAERNLSYRPKTITVAAEPLYDYQREMIESVFQCKVFDWYGSRELGHMASECRTHNGLHINAYHLFFEVISDGKQVYDSEGTLVVTDLRNKAMPLIRYEIGDVGVISKRLCSCGSALPLLEHVSGRLVDTFLTRSGGRVPGVALTNRIIKDCQGIEQMQIVQRDFELFTIRIVKGKAFSENVIITLNAALHAYLKTEVNIEHEFVSSIPLEKSGKSRFCVCEMAQTPASISSH